MPMLIPEVATTFVVDMSLPLQLTGSAKVVLRHLDLCTARAPPMVRRKAHRARRTECMAHRLLRDRRFGRVPEDNEGL